MDSDKIVYTRDVFKQLFIQMPMSKYWVYAISISVINWIIFKFFYPHPNLIFDSYYYVLAAVKNDNVSVWPIGYSKFISIIGSISHSANFLLTIQYIILQGSFIFFFYSITFLFSLSRYSSNILFILLFLNPIYLYASNLVLSDILFLSFSLLWIINLLWILFNPQPWMVICQAVLLIFAFTLRHSASFYPLIGIMVILLSRFQLRYKYVAIGLQVFFISTFVLYTTRENEKIFGVKQFSPFEGWKVASNALYFYEHIPDNKVKIVPLGLQKIDSLVRSYYRSKHDVQSLFKKDPSWGSYYMFNYPSPLLVYKDQIFHRSSKLHIDPYSFSKLGPIYDEYGKFLILNYPGAYVKRVVLPNAFFYLFPYPEVFVDTLNPFKIQEDSVGKVAKEWFKIDDVSVPIKMVEFRHSLFSYYPVHNTVTHLFFIFFAVVFLYYRAKVGISNKVLLSLLLMITLWAVHFVFIIISSASLLRYQLFIITIEQAFSLIIWNRFKTIILN